MDDPVIALDGHTYERRAIERWLERRHTSPKTGQELTNTMLLPNHAMRGQILEWREQHAGTARGIPQLKPAAQLAASSSSSAVSGARVIADLVLIYQSYR